MLSSVILIDLVTRLLGLVRSLINPRLLGAEAYGRLGVLSAVLLFAAFCDLGMNREFELAFPHAPNPKQAVTRALRLYLVRAAAPIGILTVIIVASFGILIGAVCVPYLVSFGMTEIFLIALRAQKKYALINAYALGSAVVLTAALVVVAPRFGVQGVATLQSAVGVVGAAALAVAFLPVTAQLVGGDFTLPGLSFRKGSALWLLLGQALPLIWLTIDRFVLSGRIDARSMGYWTLGGLPGSLLAGLTNTTAALHMSAWIRKERTFVTQAEAFSFAAITAAGLAAYRPFVAKFLPEYLAGVGWNLRLIVAHAGVALLFFYDGYRRSQMASPSDAQDWFYRKTIFTVLGFGLPVALTVFLNADLRLGVIWGFHATLLLTWAFEKKWTVFLVQVGLAGLSTQL